MISYMLLCSISGLGLITLAYYILEPKKAFADIPGPSATSWLYGMWRILLFVAMEFKVMMQGNMLDLVLNAPYGQHEFKWQRQYGQVYRIKGCIGVNNSTKMSEHRIPTKVNPFAERPSDGVRSDDCAVYSCRQRRFHEVCRASSHS